jgi:phosphonate transport system permease protein
MKKRFFYLGIAILILAFSFHLELSITELSAGIPNLLVLLDQSIPPDKGILTIGALAIAETIQIAFIGTVLGLVISLPLALLSSRNLFSKRFVVPSRLILGMFRTLPSLLWAVVFVIMVGVGPFAGVLAVMMYTCGYLGKLQYEAIEGIDKEALEAVSSTGASTLQRIRFSVLPLAANHLYSQLLFVFEYNVRSSTILGFVGAGGIGFYLSSYLRFLEYDKVLSLLILIFIVVLIIDVVSIKIRDRYLS